MIELAWKRKAGSRSSRFLGSCRVANTLAHRKRWDGKYSQGTTHTKFCPDAGLDKLGHYFPTSGLVLDVACGTGRNSFYMVERGFDVVCIDFSEQAFRIFEQHRSAHPQARRLHPVIADLANIPLPDHKFDVVLVVRYLNRMAFNSYLDTLIPGGILFFKAFNINHLQQKPGFNPDYLLKPGELKEYFRNCNIIFTNDSDTISDFETCIVVQK